MKKTIKVASFEGADYYIAVDNVNKKEFVVFPMKSDSAGIYFLNKREKILIKKRFFETYSMFLNRVESEVENARKQIEKELKVQKALFSFNNRLDKYKEQNKDS